MRTPLLFGFLTIDTPVGNRIVSVNTETELVLQPLDS